MWTRITRIFFNLSPPVADRRSETRAPALAPLPLAHSAAGGERLYATAVADERDHDGYAGHAKDALRPAPRVLRQTQAAGDLPARSVDGSEDVPANPKPRAAH